jgi:ectoine hydroxylase-related dioxygenase (phytanoyl-CoA dioxygenase family)
MDSVRSVLPTDLAAKFNPVPIEVKAGECAFHHPRMMHGSFENRTDGPRRGTVVNVILDGVASDSDEPLLKDVPLLQRGEKLDGQFFPLLFNPSVIS